MLKLIKCSNGFACKFMMNVITCVLDILKKTFFFAYELRREKTFLGSPLRPDTSLYSQRKKLESLTFEFIGMRS